MYQVVSLDEPRRVIAKIEWYPGELSPRVGVIVSNLAAEPEEVTGPMVCAILAAIRGL